MSELLDSYTSTSGAAYDLIKEKCDITNCNVYVIYRNGMPVTSANTRKFAVALFTGMRLGQTTLIRKGEA